MNSVLSRVILGAVLVAGIAGWLWILWHVVKWAL